MRGGDVFRGVWRNVGGLGVGSATGPMCLFIGQRLWAMAPLARWCYCLPPVITGGAIASWAVPLPTASEHCSHWCVLLS